jgi:hypothetical protein
MSDGISITGKERIERARWLAVRSALKLEIGGIGRRGTSARILANRITGKDLQSGVKAYEALNKKIVETLGEQFNRPL